MIFLVKIEVMPRAHTPESAAIWMALQRGGYECVASLRKGKVFALKITAADANDAHDTAALLCLNYLVEPNTEQHEIVSVREG